MTSCVAVCTLQGKKQKISFKSSSFWYYSTDICMNKFGLSYFIATNPRYGNNSIIARSFPDLTPLVRFENHLCCDYVDITEGLNLRLVNIWAPPRFHFDCFIVMC